MRLAMYMLKESATIGALEKGWKATSKGKLIRRDFGSLESGKEMASLMGGKLGPITIPTTSRKILPDSLKNLSGKFLIKGNTAGTLNDSNKAQGMRMKHIKQTPATSRGVNATTNIHESDEMKQFSKKNNPQTMLGAQYGHHSISKILGPESNRYTNASDRTTKAGGAAMKRFRKATREKEMFDELALKTKNGEQPFKYGEGKKLNRSHREAMYKKELSISGIKDRRRTKKQRMADYEESRKQ